MCGVTIGEEQWGTDVILKADPIQLVTECQVPKQEHFPLIIVWGKNFELSDIPLKRGSFLAKKRAADHSHGYYVQFCS